MSIYQHFFVCILIFLSSLSSTSPKIISSGFENMSHICSHGFFFIYGLKYFFDKNLFEICY